MVVCQEIPVTNKESERKEKTTTFQHKIKILNVFMLSYLKSDSTEDTARNNGFNLQESTFLVNIRKYFLTIRTVKQKCLSI